MDPGSHWSQGRFPSFECFPEGHFTIAQHSASVHGSEAHTISPGEALRSFSWLEQSCSIFVLSAFILAHVRMNSQQLLPAASAKSVSPVRWVPSPHISSVHGIASQQLLPSAFLGVVGSTIGVCVAASQAFPGMAKCVAHVAGVTVQHSASVHVVAAHVTVPGEAWMRLAWCAQS